MSKTQAERPLPAAAPAPAADLPGTAPPLSASVRRHLGQGLRRHYAETLSAPVSERLEALIARLDKPER